MGLSRLTQAPCAGGGHAPYARPSRSLEKGWRITTEADGTIDATKSAAMWDVFTDPA
jgi:hypothetical protein